MGKINFNKYWNLLEWEAADNRYDKYIDKIHYNLQWDTIMKNHKIAKEALAWLGPLFSFKTVFF